MVPLIKRLGAERFVFGTDVYSWPLSTHGSHILGQLLESDLDREVLATVLGGNLRRILGLAPTGA